MALSLVAAPGGAAARGLPPGGLLRTGAAVSGCGKPAPAGDEFHFEIGGVRRFVIVHLPTRYSESHEAALVLNLHGSGSSPASQEAFSGMDATANAGGFIVAYPRGGVKEGSGWDWNIPGVPLFGGGKVPSGSPDDVSFLVSLVRVLEGRYCINPARVYATGFSGGARMASQLACDASQVFAAVAPVSGLRRATPCPTRRAVPVVAFHGTADPVDPYAGHGQAYWTYSVPTAARYWARQDGCELRAVTTRLSPAARRVSYGHCKDGAAVELYVIVGEGHEWPDGPPMPKSLTAVLGPQSRAVDANRVMWSFFLAHPLT